MTSYEMLFSDSPKVALESAYTLISTDKNLNLGLAPAKDPSNLTKEENEKFYTALNEFFRVATNVFCLTKLNARTTGEYIEDGQIVEITLEAYRALPYTINDKKIVLNSQQFADNDVKIFCTGANRKISQEFTAAAVEDDKMFTAKASFAIPDEYLENNVRVIAYTSGFNVRRLVPLQR